MPALSSTSLPAAMGQQTSINSKGLQESSWCVYLQCLFQLLSDCQRLGLRHDLPVGATISDPGNAVLLIVVRRLEGQAHCCRIVSYNAACEISTS